MKTETIDTKSNCLSALAKHFPHVASALDTTLSKVVQNFPMAELRAKRQRLGITQYQLADGIGIKQPHVANMEAGRGNPSSIVRAKWILYLTLLEEHAGR